MRFELRRAGMAVLEEQLEEHEQRRQLAQEQKRQVRAPPLLAAPQGECALRLQKLLSAHDSMNGLRVLLNGAATLSGSFRAVQLYQLKPNIG